MLNTHSREADAMRKLTFGMNLSLDGYIAASGDDLGWSVPSDELFQWWSDRVGATGLALYGRKLWDFFTALDNWVNLNLVETRTFPDGVLLTRYETSP